MAENEARKYQGPSPRINNSDYKARESIGKKRIFSDDDKNPSTCCGCPRWGCLVIFFILFGSLTGVTTWLIVKNQMFNTNNPEVKVQYNKIVNGVQQANENSTITNVTVTTENPQNATNTINTTNTTDVTETPEVAKHKHYMRHDFEEIY